MSVTERIVITAIVTPVVVIAVLVITTLLAYVPHEPYEPPCRYDYCPETTDQTSQEKDK